MFVCCDCCVLSGRGLCDVLITVVRRCVWSRNLVKMRSHTQSVVIELNRRRITHWMHFLQAIKSDLSVLIVCNKTGGTIKGYIYIYIYKNKLRCVLPITWDILNIYDISGVGCDSVSNCWWPLGLTWEIYNFLFITLIAAIGVEPRTYKYWAASTITTADT